MKPTINVEDIKKKVDYRSLSQVTSLFSERSRCKRLNPVAGCSIR